MSEYDDAPHYCDKHGKPRWRGAQQRGFCGWQYECGCMWGSDDGRGEAWDRSWVGDPYHTKEAQS